MIYKFVVSWMRGKGKILLDDIEIEAQDENDAWEKIAQLTTDRTDIEIIEEQI